MNERRVAEIPDRAKRGLTLLAASFALRHATSRSASCASGSFVATASRDRSELLTAELYFGKIHEVRNVWQFYRDRRPD